MAGKAKTKIVGGERIDLGTGQPFVPETITSDSLTPQAGFNIPPVSNAAPDAAGLQGSLSAIKDQFTQQRIKASEEAKTAKDTSLSALLDSLKDSPGEVALTSEKYSESVDPLQKETTDLENQLDAEQRALENQMRDIEDAGGGLVSGQNIELQRVRGESLRRQADIAVVLKAKSGQLADARAIADRAVSAQLEQQRQRNDILTLVYNENKSLFDKEEQRQFEVQMSDRQRALDEESENKKSIYNLAIEAVKNGAGNATVQSILSSKTPQAALVAAGSSLAPKSTASAPKLQNFGTSDKPLWRQYNYQSGQWEAVSGLDGSGMSVDQIAAIDNGISETQTSLNIVDNLLDNNRGIGAITGQFKSPTVSGFFQGGKADEGAATLFRYVPVVGNVIGSIQSRNAKDSALTDLTYVYNTEGFKEFTGLKQSGLTFGSLTGGERQAIFAAANRLNSAVTIQEGGDSSIVTGYRGTAEELEQDLQLIAKGLKARQDELNAQLMLNNDDKLMIINTR